MLWWGPHAAPYTVYVPFAAGMTALPDSTLGIYSTLDKSTLFWGVRYLANHAYIHTYTHTHIHTYTHTHIHACMHACMYAHTCMHTCIHTQVRYLANLCQLKRSYAIQDVNALQNALHDKGLQVQADLDAAAKGGNTPAALTNAYLSHAEEVLKALFTASDDLFFKYADGWVSEVAADGTFSSRVVPAPDWWLRAVNYTDGPPPVPP